MMWSTPWSPSRRPVVGSAGGGILALVLLGNLVHDLTRLAAAPTQPSGTRTSERKADPASDEVANLFRRNCQTCHGADGKGGGTRRHNLPRIPDFSRPAWQATRADGQLLASILNGKGSAMPAFSGRLGEEQAQALVGYVRLLAPQSNRPAAVADDDFDRQFRELENEMKELRRQFQELSSRNER